ncbi:MAG: toprim domain-containing protein [Verrucomicrobiota bacterium]
MLVNQRPEERDFREFDNEASLLEAKARMPLDRLMAQFGDEPPPIGKKWAGCPFCKKKDTARITDDGQQKFFKCANTNCPSATSDKGKSWTELHYLKFKQPGLDNKETFISYLKLAGVWKERMKFKSAKGTKPAPPPAPEPEPEPQPAVPIEAPFNPVVVPDPEPIGDEAPWSETVDPALNRKAVEEALEPVKKPEPVSQKRKTEDDGYAALAEFFGTLTLLPEDEELLFRKRGLTSRTSELLRFRSNPRTNKASLLELREIFSKDELLASGLWKRNIRAKGEIKPNSQFCGAGIKRKLKEGEPLPEEPNTWVDEERSLWGWVCPLLIPYFDEDDRIVGLRPHKGGGQGGTLTGTARVYIPRAAGRDPELFRTVVITEGEFKAAALWQVLGAGRQDGEEPLGVVALPGISFAKHYDIREELDTWLREVNCRRVIVAYDNEEKGDPKLESYKPDMRKRFDAQIWARTLATDLALKLHIRGEVCVLPMEWRNEKGKADWDGALVKLIEQNA